MGIFNGFFAAVLAAFMLWLLFRSIKNNPEQFSVKNINKSMGTMGILAIILIVVIAFVVMMLKV